MGKKGGRETSTDRGVMPHQGTGLEIDGPGQHAATAQRRSCSEPCLNRHAERYVKLHWPGELHRCLAMAYRLDHFVCRVGLRLADPSLCLCHQPVAALLGRGRAPNPTSPGGSDCSAGRSAASETTSPSGRAACLSQANDTVPATFLTGTSCSEISPCGMANSNLPAPRCCWALRSEMQHKKQGSPSPALANPCIAS